MTGDGLYCDGGVVGRNPSRLGITWAWCLAEGGAVAASGSGLLEPADLGVDALTNNHAELIAALRALGSAPEGWRGPLHTDSEVTARRLVSYPPPAFNGCPRWLVRAAALARRGRPEVVVVGGHPTKADLIAGRLARNGRPCSRWNVWCDQECVRLARNFLKRSKL